MKVDCNECNASKYAGYANIDNSVESCLMFNVELKQRKDGSTIPCDECKGIYFKEDEY